MSGPVSESISSEESVKPIRFGLWHLFYFTALVASGLVVAGGYSFLISGLVLAGWWIRFRATAVFAQVALFCFIVLILIGMLLPTVSVVRVSTRRIECLNNMRQLMLAMLNYESTNRHFAPAWTVDDHGQPMHSWRVLILPCIEEQVLYSQYRFDERWDSPHNAKLGNQMPRGFHCPSLPYSTSHTTYKLVSDKEAFFDADKRPTFSDAHDGSTSTIALVEDSENPVPWMKPDGISIEDAVTVLLSREGCHCDRTQSLFKTYYFGQNVAALDGAVYDIPPNTTPEDLRMALRSADGHSPDLSRFSGAYVVHHPQGYIALALYIILLAFPGWYLKRT